jgi:hypothetical protein
VAVSPEFTLAVDCCRCSFRNHYGEGPSIPASIDWSKFLQLVRFHRIEGLASNTLANVEEAPEEVRSAGTRIAAQNLKAIDECRKLLESFGNAGVPFLFLKGLTVGALAYRNPALKMAVDIDLLIDGRDLQTTSLLLSECGYALADPKEPAKLHSWHRVSKESTWIKPGLQVDLHTRVADNSHLLPDIGVHSPRQSVEVAPGIDLPTLAPDELFAYLAVHGASSAWFRLKWISDFAALLHCESMEEIERKYRFSQEVGAGRAAGQALLLAHELFGSLGQTPALRDELIADAGTRRLFRTALQLVTRKPAEPTASIFGTLPIHWTQLLLLPGLSFKWSELSRQTNAFLTLRT